MRQVQILLVAELTINPADTCQSISSLAQAKLDAFREAVQPSTEHGVVLRRATRSDVAAFRPDQVEVEEHVPVRPVLPKVFQVHEYKTCFSVEHVPTGQSRLVNRADAIEKKHETCSPGNPGFRALWEDRLNEDAAETLRRYFPDL